MVDDDSGASWHDASNCDAPQKATPRLAAHRSTPHNCGACGPCCSGRLSLQLRSAVTPSSHRLSSAGSCTLRRQWMDEQHATAQPVGSVSTRHTMHRSTCTARRGGIGLTSNVPQSMPPLAVGNVQHSMQCLAARALADQLLVAHLSRLCRRQL